MVNSEIDVNEYLVRAIKYSFQFSITTFVAYYVTRLTIYKSVLLGIVSATTFAFIEILKPSIGDSLVDKNKLLLKQLGYSVFLAKFAHPQNYIPR